MSCKKNWERAAGRVYKAYDTMLDRTVVLKLLAVELMTEEESRKRFLREGVLHPRSITLNICTIFEIAEVDNQYFIAMQYVPGKTLKKVIEASRSVLTACSRSVYRWGTRLWQLTRKASYIAISNRAIS
jgi:serine/threonine protein kinase